MFNARVLCDSISPDNIRLTTLEITYPRIIHAEFMTHRVTSKNSSSSRAIPVEKFLKKVLEDPFIPSYWGKNQKGMQAQTSLSPEESLIAKDYWLAARDQAVFFARKISDLGVHKQLTNRLLEPFQYHTTLVTSTEWSNFFGLRRHPDAQPEFKVLADLMFQALEESIPFCLDYGQYHLPLIHDYAQLKEDRFSDLEIVQIAVGRCCRVSYLTHDGRRDPQADLNLCRQLQTEGHMSPFEHVACPMTQEEIEQYSPRKCSNDFIPFLGNFKGWVQFRKTLPDEDDYSKLMKEKP